MFSFSSFADIVPSIENPKYFEANVTGTLNVLKQLKNIKKKNNMQHHHHVMVSRMLSTSEKIDNKYPYALTKYLGENFNQLVKNI